MTQAVVNKIIPFSSVDGPGNRTAVFLQGCNIDCKYCHNPETRGMCVNCGKCVSACPAGALSFSQEGKVVYDSDKCCQCDTCIHVCEHDSSPRTAVMTPEQVMDRVLRQVPFIRGITVSGGECTLHPDFLTKLFRLTKSENLGTLIDSNGTFSFASAPELMEVTDGVMLDIKAFEESSHLALTGAGNRIVLDNAQFLGKCGKLEEVRCVIAPDLYDTEKSVSETAAFLAPLLAYKMFRVKIIAFRPNGVREQYKHVRVPSKEELIHLSDIFRAHGFEDIVII